MNLQHEVDTDTKLCKTLVYSLNDQITSNQNNNILSRQEVTSPKLSPDMPTATPHQAQIISNYTSTTPRHSYTVSTRQVGITEGVTPHHCIISFTLLTLFLPLSMTLSSH